MRMVIKYTDTETQPQFIVNNEGKVTEIIIEAPFIITKRRRTTDIKEKGMDIVVGLTNICIGCGEPKRQNQFHREIKGATGVQKRCITCQKKIDKERGKKHEDE